MQQSLRYLEEDGNRFIVEDQLGKAFSYKSSRLVLNLFVNGLHFVLWFVVLWLLLALPVAARAGLRGCVLARADARVAFRSCSIAPAI